MPSTRHADQCTRPVGWEEYARSIHALLTGLGTGIPSSIDFASRTLVGVGHSMGAIALQVSRPVRRALR